MGILILVILIMSSTFANTAIKSQENVKATKITQEEVIDNPTLKTMSGSLNRISFYSRFTYRGSSLKDPISAERPNLREISATPSLVNMSGVFGLKYRLSKQDNISLQMGVYSTTPFHSSIDTENDSNKNDFEKNGQKTTSDDPLVSYFRTYTIGELQNISFFQYQHITRDIYKEYGGKGIFRFSQASAYRVNKAFYVAATLTYENYTYDKDFINYFGKRVSIRSKQREHTYRGNLSAEYYFDRTLSFRFITDVFSFVRYRDANSSETVSSQQTIGMTYFFSRDISIAPNVQFIMSDLRSDRTTTGLNINVNI